MQNDLLKKFGKTADFDNDRDPLLLEMLPAERGEEISMQLDGDCSNNMVDVEKIKKEDLTGDDRVKFSCVYTFLKINNQEEIFLDAVQLGKYLILSNGIKYGFIKEGTSPEEGEEEKNEGEDQPSQEKEESGDPIIAFLKDKEADFSKLPSAEVSDFMKDDIQHTEVSELIKPSKHEPADVFISKCMGIFSLITGGHPMNVFFFNFKKNEMRLDSYPTHKQRIENPKFQQFYSLTQSYIIFQDEQ